MTAVDVCFKYGLAPGELEAAAINSAREVYGIRKISFDEGKRTVRVEFDATRFSDTAVADLLRRAGLDLKEKILLA